MDLKFINCTEDSCVFNNKNLHQCQASFIFLNNNGECCIRDNTENNSFNSSYVEFRECLCTRCHFFEKKTIMNNEVGCCEYGNELSFDIQRDSSGNIIPQ